MDSSEEVLRGDGVRPSEIELMRKRVAVGTRRLFDDYNVSLDDETVEVIEQAFLDAVVDYGTSTGSSDTKPFFDTVMEDFERDEENPGRSNIYMALGRAREELDDPPKPLIEIGGAVLARNYQHGTR